MNQVDMLRNANKTSSLETIAAKIKFSRQTTEALKILRVKKIKSQRSERSRNPKRGARIKVLTPNK